MKRIAPRDRLVNYGLFAYHNNRVDVPKRNKREYSDFIKIARKLWEVTVDNFIEKEGGVVLDEFGYLAHWMSPKKIVFKVPRKGGMKLMPNYHTNSYFYNSALFTNIFSKDFLREWTLDRGFSERVKQSRFKKLMTGFKYTFHYRLVKRIYSNRFINKK